MATKHFVTLGWAATQLNVPIPKLERALRKANVEPEYAIDLLQHFDLIAVWDAAEKAGLREGCAEADAHAE